MKRLSSELKIFAGNSNPRLVRRITDYLGVPLGKATVTTFPDGETFVKFDESIRERDIFIVQSTCPPTNHNLMELLIMIDAARRASPARITAVLPFFGYARQDRKDQPRVPITAKLVANILVAAGTNRVLTMDLHAQQIQGFFDIPVDHLYCAPVLFEYLKAKKLTDLTVISPDIGGLKMASAYANMLGGGIGFVASQRVSATEKQAMSVVGDVKGRNCLIVDDMTETAGTLCTAAAALKEAGARKIYAGVSHAILGKLALERLHGSAIEELITTDSVPHDNIKGVKLAELSVAKLLGEAIRRIHSSESVTSLFRMKNKKG